MVKRVILSIAVLAAAGPLSAAIVLLSTGAGRAEPPVLAVPAGAATPAADAVANFTPFDPPRPASPRLFADGAGRQVSLTDFRGRVVLLNFWATWCGPCVEEMPSLDRLQARLGGRGLAVIALSQDRQGADRVRRFYRREGLSRLRIYLDPRNRVARDFAVEGLPTTVLIDRRGRAVGQLVGAADWGSPAAAALIGRYLAAPPPEESGLIRTGW